MQVYDTALQQELEDVRHDNPLVWAYILNRANSPTDVKALQTIDRSEAWLHTQPNKDYIQELAFRLKSDAPQHALTLLQQAATKAAQNMLDLANNASDERVKFQANKDIMDRLGMKAPEKLQIEAGASIRSIDEVLLQVYGKRVAELAAGQGAGDMIDGEMRDATEADE